ncbi:MAG: glutathione peroxidase [Verrucomicrobiota bacterium]
MKRLILSTFALVAAMTTTIAASVQDIPLKDIDGKDTSLKAYQGKVVLVVNVASKCGLTPQYTALEALYRKYKDQGLVIVGFPCNDFGAQEPGTPTEIKTFCSTKYDVTFPLMSKLHVKGPEQHPLYLQLTGKDAKFPGDIEWNFGKFLIARDGTVIQRFSPKTTPDSPEVTTAVQAALKAK